MIRPKARVGFVCGVLLLQAVNVAPFPTVEQDSARPDTGRIGSNCLAPRMARRSASNCDEVVYHSIFFFPLGGLAPSHDEELILSHSEWR